MYLNAKPALLLVDRLGGTMNEVDIMHGKLTCLEHIVASLDFVN